MMRIEILNQQHKRGDFHCGNTALDDYFHHYVMQDQKRFLSTCYVLSEGEKVIGFYTLSPHQIDAEKLTLFLSKRKIGPYPIVPVYLLGRLAVDSEFKKQGVGSFLLTNALKQVKNNNIRGLGVVVEAKDENALAFYLKKGFHHLEGLKAIFLTEDI